MNRYVKRTLQTIVGLVVIGLAVFLIFGPGIVEKRRKYCW